MSENCILTHAAKILNERQDEYGDPVELLTTIADRALHDRPQACSSGLRPAAL